MAMNVDYSIVRKHKLETMKAILRVITNIGEVTKVACSMAKAGKEV